MPELPEVETVKIGLNQHTLGWQIVGGEVLLASTITAPASPAEFLSALTGLAIATWQRRGKYLLAELVNKSGQPGGYLGVHLRMTGRLLWCDRHATPHKHTRVRLYLDLKNTKQELRFDDQRTFGRMWWVSPDQELTDIITGLKKLGKEPFDPDFTIAHLAEKLKKSDRPIKNLLLDQATVAGIGNIYADESLFLSQIHPTISASRIQPSQVAALHSAIRKCLGDSIALGGTTFSDFQDLGGEKGNYLDQAWVFRHQGQPCLVCGTAIERIRLGGRATHFCPSCQALKS